MKQYVYLILFSFATIIECRRSPFRTIDPLMPQLITQSQKNPDIQFVHSDWFYYKSPIFTTFSENSFFSHIVQHSITTPIDHKVVVSNETLDTMLETLISEVKMQNNVYTYFTLLQDKNFNYKKKCGLLVLKFNHYPFVVKLFMEQPNTILNPFVKGFENRVFHFMGHGVNRHIAGLTRIPNLKKLQQVLQHKQYQVVLPRKWFWLPQDPEWIDIIGYNIVPDEVISVTIPGIYAIIADELKTQQQYQKVPSSKSNEIIMDFCNDVQLIIDPHSDNFIIQKDNNDSIIISIVDTEHFPTLVGISENSTFVNHVQWYCSLAWKALSDLLTTSKKNHLAEINK